MTEQPNNLATLFAACWKDPDLKARFQSNPAQVLAEYGMEVPEGIDVNVVENNDNTVHITLPVAPDNNGNLSDDELADAAGGIVGNEMQHLIYVQMITNAQSNLLGSIDKNPYD